MKFFRTYDKDFEENEIAIGQALKKYFFPIISTNSILLLLLFWEDINTKYLLYTIFFLSASMYLILMLIKDLPFYGKQKDTPYWLNKIFITFFLIGSTFFLYVCILITFGETHPQFEKLICCEHVSSWYQKEHILHQSQ